VRQAQPRLVFKALRWFYHSTLGSRVIKKKKQKSLRTCAEKSLFPSQFVGAYGLIRANLDPNRESWKGLTADFEVSLLSSLPACGFRVSGFGFRVSGFGFRGSGLGFRGSGLGFRVSGLGGFGFGFRVSGFGFRVSRFWLRVSGRVANACWLARSRTAFHSFIH